MEAGTVDGCVLWTRGAHTYDFGEESVTTGLTQRCSSPRPENVVTATRTVVRSTRFAFNVQATEPQLARAILVYDVRSAM